MTRKRRSQPPSTQTMAAQCAVKVPPPTTPSPAKRTKKNMSPTLKRTTSAEKSATRTIDLFNISEGDSDQDQVRASPPKTRSKTRKEQYKPLVIQADPYLVNFTKSARVVLDDDSSPCDALLMKVNVSDDSKFIIIQVVEYQGSYYVCRREGRIGYTGRTYTPRCYGSRYAAVNDFQNVFFSLTDVVWISRDQTVLPNLPAHQRSYTYVERDYGMNGSPFSEELLASLRSRSTTRAGSKKRAQSVSTTRTSAVNSVCKVRRSSLKKKTQVQRAPRPRRTHPSYLTSMTYSELIVQELRVAAHIGFGGPPSYLSDEIVHFLSIIMADGVTPDDELANTDNLLIEKARCSVINTEDDFGDLVTSYQERTFPVGLPARSTMLKAYATLNQLYTAVSVNATTSRVMALSNKFFCLAPERKPSSVIIDSMLKIGVQVTRLTKMTSMLGGRASFGHGHQKLLDSVDVRSCITRNYLDESYAMLGCKLRPLCAQETAMDLVQQYMSNASCCSCQSSYLQIDHVFEVMESIDSYRFQNFASLGNITMLWHGSRHNNWPGILSKGLQVAPPGVTANGSTFGRGIYFTDIVAKSLSYCLGPGDDDKCILLLSEVALGDTKKVYGPDDKACLSVQVSCTGQPVKNRYQSLQGVGIHRVDPTRHVLDTNGVTWPIGPLQRQDDLSTTLHHTEYVVFRPEQVRMRYVVVATFAH